MSKNRLSTGSIVSRASDILNLEVNLEVSCNSRGSLGPTWKLAILLLMQVLRATTCKFKYTMALITWLPPGHFSTGVEHPDATSPVQADPRSWLSRQQMSTSLQCASVPPNPDHLNGWNGGLGTLQTFPGAVWHGSTQESIPWGCSGSPGRCGHLDGPCHYGQRPL